ncbi:MAG: NUDIX hydrolase [Nanoarchaeota archaeon]
MIYTEKPQEFYSKFDVVSCFVEHNGEILLLHRQDHKPQGNTWGVSAGKVDGGEQVLEAMVREIYEETGFKLVPSQLAYFGKLYVKYPKFDFIYHIFHTKLDKQPEVVIAPNEHKSFNWISPEKALEMSLIQDLDACIKLFYKI